MRSQDAGAQNREVTRTQFIGTVAMLRVHYLNVRSANAVSYSLLGLFEISQIRRCLILLGGHQKAIRAEEIVFLADDDLAVALGASIFAPIWTRIRVAPKSLVHAPRLRQGMVKTVISS